jgi:hypothetical protein
MLRNTAILSMLVLLLIIGCDQNPIAENEMIPVLDNNEFSIIDGRVVFENFDSYASYIQGTKTRLSISSIKQLINVQDYVDPFDTIFKRHASKEQVSSAETYNEDYELPSNSEILLSLLNERGIIQVGDKVIRYTQHFDFSTSIENVSKLEDDRYLVNLISETMISSKSTNTFINVSSDVNIHPVYYSTNENDCDIDFVEDGTVLQINPCEDISNPPNPTSPPTDPSVVEDYVTTPINTGRYVRYVDDRRAQLHVHYKTSDGRLEIKPSIDQHERRSRRLGFFVWNKSYADILYAEVYDVVLTKYYNNYWSGPSELYTPNVNYPNFDDFEITATSFGTKDNYRHERQWLHFPLDLSKSYRVESIKSINYIEAERSGKIYKVKRIVENASGSTFRFF